MKSYKKWLEENIDEISDQYEFDVHNALNEGEYESISSFAGWSKIVYQGLKDDEKYDKENGGGKK